MSMYTVLYPSYSIVSWVCMSMYIHYTVLYPEYVWVCIYSIVSFIQYCILSMYEYVYSVVSFIQYCILSMLITGRYSTSIQHYVVRMFHVHIYFVSNRTLLDLALSENWFSLRMCESLQNRWFNLCFEAIFKMFEHVNHLGAQVDQFHEKNGAKNLLTLSLGL